MSKILNKLLLFLKNRLVLLGISILLLFSSVIFKFYDLQITQHHYYVERLNKSIQRVISTPGTRGVIYDCNGKVLATNKPVYVLCYDLQKQIPTKEKHQLFIALEKAIHSYGDRFIDEIPISKKPPYSYTGSESELRKFLGNIPSSTDLMREELKTYTPDEIIDYLKQQFKIADDYTVEEVRTLIGIEYELYMYSYKQYESVRLSDEISPQSCLYLQEQSKQFPGVSVQVRAERTYPYGEAFSSVLGYIGKMTDTQSETYLSKGYGLWEEVGQMGLEKSLENSLHGEAGEEIIEVNQKGQRAAIVSTKKPGMGSDVYLTLDADLQQVAYESIEKRLSEAIIDRLSRKVNGITSKEVLYSIIDCNTLQLNLMQMAPRGTVQFSIYQRLVETYNKLDPVMTVTISLKDLLLEGFSNGSLMSEKELLLALNEQQAICLDNHQIQSLKKELTGTTEHYLSNLLHTGSLKPSQMNITPSNGAAAIVDVNTGEVLSVVSYPTYDNNEMVNRFSEYWTRISNDNRSLLWNRSLQTLKAPGSTFKMLTAIAGLEEGVITPEDEIVDLGIYEKAGSPYPKCWVANTTGITHGNVNLHEALAVSCNYYFYEVAMRLENVTEQPFDAARILSYYGEKLGLDATTGVELEEAEPCISKPSTFLNRQIKTAISAYQREGNQDRAKRIKRVKEVMSQGILGDLSLDNNKDVLKNNRDEKKLTLVVEPIVQKRLMPLYDSLIEEIYHAIDAGLEVDKESLIDDWVIKALMVNDLGQIETVIKKSVSDQVQLWINQILDDYLESFPGQLDENILLDAYEGAYTQIYRQLIRQSDGKSQALIMKAQLRDPLTIKNKFTNDILLKIRQNMINIIVNDLLNGVELKWSDGISVRSAIGQGDNAFSPMQIARYIAGLANGKYICDLTLVKNIYDDTKGMNAYKLTTQKTPLNLKDKTITAIHEGMLAVTTETDGTAYEKFKDLNVRIAAKTGTAEEGKHTHSWFVGFAPYENPEIAIVVTLYDTDGLGSYSQDIAKDLISYYFDKK